MRQNGFMLELLEAIEDIGAVDRWLVRGWRYLGSRRCRDECHDEWRRKGRLFAVADVSLLLLMMGLEVALMMVLLIVGLEI